MYLVLIPAALLGSGINVYAEEGASVRILFTNNSNGKLVDCNCRNDPFGGLAERADLIQSYRTEHPEVLVLDSGGYFGLTNSEAKGNLILNLMDTMGYDAIGIGDQELYRGLENFLDSFGWYRENIISASVRTQSGDSVFTPYRIITAGGIRIGIIGLMSGETFKFFPKDRIDFIIEEPDETLNRLIPELKRSCDYIVVLSQMGVNGDKELAEKWTDIGLIIGGHSQTMIETPIKSGNTRIVQAGKNAGRIGEIILSFSESKSVESFSYNLLEVSDKYKILPEIQTLFDNAMKTQ